MYAMYHENASILKSKDLIHKYILGGKGVVTLESPTGKHYSYSFRRPRSATSFPEDTRFAYVRCDHGVWKYVGMLEDSQFRATYNSSFDVTSEEFKGAKYIVRMSLRDFNTPMKLYHEGVCACCGRKLTDPKSIRIGFGPRCYKMMNQ